MKNPGSGGALALTSQAQFNTLITRVIVGQTSRILSDAPDMTDYEQLLVLLRCKQMHWLMTHVLCVCVCERITAGGSKHTSGIKLVKMSLILRHNAFVSLFFMYFHSTVKKKNKKTKLWL